MRKGIVLDSNSLGILAALGSAASWAIGAVLFKHLGESLSSFAMTLVQGALSVILLGTLTLLTCDYNSIGYDAYFYLVLSGIVGISISGTFFFSALKMVSAQVITLLFVLGQVITVLLACYLLGETLPLSGWLGIALIITGITIGIFPRELSKRESTVRGIVYGLISVILMSVAVILTKKGLTAEVSTLHATFIRMLAGTSGILVVGIITGNLGGWVAPFRDVQLIAKFSIAVCIITFGGFWLAIVAFKYTNVVVASSLISTEQIFVLPVSALLLKNKISGQSITGAVIATTGIIALYLSGSLQ